MNQKLEKIETALAAFHVRKEYAGYTFLLRGIALVGEKLPQKLTFAELAEKVLFQEHLDTKTVKSKLRRAVSALWRDPGNWTLLHQIEGEGTLPENAEPIDVIHSLAYYVKEQSNN